MPRPTLARVAGCALFAIALLAPTHARAAVTVYTSLAAFQAAAPTAVLATTFESKAVGATANFSLGGIDFAGANMFIIGPTTPGTTLPLPPSHMLSANGEENFTMTIASGQAHAFGFTLLTNQYTPHTATLAGNDGVVYFTYHPTQAVNTIGFVGFVSDTPIHEVHWVAAHGELQNTAVDNIYFNQEATPATGGTWGAVKSRYR